MKEVSKVVYVCEYCGEEYVCESSALTCEKSHDYGIVTVERPLWRKGRKDPIYVFIRVNGGTPIKYWHDDELNHLAEVASGKHR